MKESHDKIYTNFGRSEFWQNRQMVAYIIHMYLIIPETASSFKYTALYFMMLIMNLSSSNNFLVPFKLCSSSSRKSPTVYNAVKG